MGKRKRIAIFANGWNNEYLQEFGQGAFQCAKVTDTDLFVFTNYSAHGLNEVDNSGEFNIYLLPDLNDFFWRMIFRIESLPHIFCSIDTFE